LDNKKNLLVNHKRITSVKAEIVASGTELLLGEVADVNTCFIANQLAVLGIDLYYVSIVGDNYERFLGVLKQAIQRSDIVVITGGLGPTKGDITREVIAGLLGEKMELDSSLQQHISGYFTRIGLEMPDNNLKQAMLIPSAIAIPNPLGTAPGWWVDKNHKIIVSLPGPPGEMQPMWQREIFPKLEKMAGAIIFSRTLKTWGLSEAKIDQLVGPFMSQANPTLALYAKPDGIQLRITAKSDTKTEALALIQSRESELRQILQDSVWGVDADILEEIVGQILIKKGLSIATAESFTGGLLAHSLASVTGNQQFFRGGLIAVDQPSRISFKIISGDTPTIPGLHTANRMASLAREMFAADIGIGLDGFTNSSRDSSFGQAFIAIRSKEESHNLTQTYPGRPGLLIRRAAMNSLFNLRKVLLSL
jgi:nicotinamide-nucleotide amidase